jgi:hypothetical protein
MNTSYTNLNEKVSRSGLLQLNPALATEFKTVTETFEGLVKRAGEGFEDSDDVGEGVEEAGGMGRQKESAARIEPRDVELGYEMVDGEMAEVCEGHGRAPMPFGPTYLTLHMMHS